MDTKLILTDLDGTLLRSDKSVSQKTIEILNECKRHGIYIGFCTSRGRQNVSQYENLSLPDIVICNGGADIIFHDKRIFNAAFTIEETRAILNKAFEVCGDDAEITLDLPDRLLWNRKHDKSTSYDHKAIYDDFKDFSQSAMKICVHTDDPVKARKISEAVSDCNMIPFSDIPWYKFSPSVSTKENAIKFLCTHLNISTDEVISFGDDHNDIGMLKLCGKGIAMENAIPEVKEIADEITLSNDQDGVAHYLEKCL